jgi:hypothetical protein
MNIAMEVMRFRIRRVLLVECCLARQSMPMAGVRG